MGFVQKLNQILEHYKAAPIKDIFYEQFTLSEFNGVVIVKDGERDIAVVDSIQKAKELIHTINSGC
jgi:hypothetical protein